jgi:hypothetical protein
MEAVALELKGKPNKEQDVHGKSRDKVGEALHEGRFQTVRPWDHGGKQQQGKEHRREGARAEHIGSGQEAVEQQKEGLTPQRGSPEGVNLRQGMKGKQQQKEQARGD